MLAEEVHLDEAQKQKILWKKWEPYLSERQWGTVREDYCNDRDTWNYFTHDQALAGPLLGEDGLGGISDERQRLASRWRYGTAATDTRSDCSG